MTRPNAAVPTLYSGGGAVMTDDRSARCVSDRALRAASEVPAPPNTRCRGLRRAQLSLSLTAPLWTSADTSAAAEPLIDVSRRLVTCIDVSAVPARGRIGSSFRRRY